MSSYTLQFYVGTKHMKFALFPFTLCTLRVVAGERWLFTFRVDAHPPNLVGILAVESLGLGDLELAQHSLQILIAMHDFLHLHEIIDKKYDKIFVLITTKYNNSYKYCSEVQSTPNLFPPVSTEINIFIFME